MITDGGGIPLATTLTGANAADVGQLIPLVDAIPPIPRESRRRATPPRSDSTPIGPTTPSRTAISFALRGIDPTNRTAPHAPTGARLGRYRWVVERTLSWFHRPRKLRLRTEWRRRHTRSVRCRYAVVSSAGVYLRVH